RARHRFRSRPDAATGYGLAAGEPRSPAPLAREGRGGNGSCRARARRLGRIERRVPRRLTLLRPVLVLVRLAQLHVLVEDDVRRRHADQPAFRTVQETALEKIIADERPQRVSARADDTA